MKTCRVLLLAGSLLGCAEVTEMDLPEGMAEEVAMNMLEGRWAAWLDSPGGKLPFGLLFEDGVGFILNGIERAPIDRVVVEGESIALHLDGYDARIAIDFSDGLDRMQGEWLKAIPGGESRLPFHALRGEHPRFAFETAADPAVEAARFAGVWRFDFADSDGTWPARAELVIEGDRVTGTTLTGTGDFRYLEGVQSGAEFRLSTFDGAHAFLFHARLTESGGLEGDFWSRDVYHATFTGKRHDDDRDPAILPDPTAEVHLTNGDGRFRFTFPDLDGNPVSLGDERFRGKVTLVELFGSWCPNCNDLGPLLADWERRYRDDGLEVVALAFEFSGDPERDGRVVREHVRRHKIEFPVLLAGVSNKSEAAKALPDLSAVKSYPTVLFIGRDGLVKKIYSGFAGPATGRHHQALVDEFEQTIETLLANTAISTTLGGTDL